MAYYNPTWKSGGHVPRVPHKIAPMQPIMTLVQITNYTSPNCTDWPQVNIHCIEHLFTVHEFWATCACPGKTELPFARGALRFFGGALGLCGGAWHSKNWQKLNCFTVFRFSILGVGALELYLRGISPQKTPVARGLCWNKTWIASISHLMKCSQRHATTITNLLEFTSNIATGVDPLTAFSGISHDDGDSD